MRKIVGIFFCLFVVSTVLFSQRTSPGSVEELSAISERGKLLSEYNSATWHASNAVKSMDPAKGTVTQYIARKVGDRWSVSFGRFSEKMDKFLIVYEANQSSIKTIFNVNKLDPPKEDTGYCLKAANAVETVLRENTGYVDFNIAFLPTKNDQWYVYLLPAQTKPDAYIFGRDSRYLVTADGSKVVERRILHRSIIEYDNLPKAAMGYHVAVQDDIPEDTDVLMVLDRNPKVEQIIATRKYIYQIDPNGRIKFIEEAEKFFSREK